MCFSRIALLLFAAGPAAAANGFMLGGGAESDSADGLGVAVVGSVGLAEETWLSFGGAKSSVDLESGRELEALYADIGIDHFFDPVGVNFSMAYWGDSDVLESNDLRASGYYRNEKVSLSLDYEFRDFDLTIPRTDFFPGRRVTFDADGFGLSARLQTSENTNIRLRGIKYDYSLPFRPIDNINAARLLSVSRLSLINSLVDHRAGLSFSVDHGLRNWTFDISTWEGIFTGSRTMSYTVRYLMPASDKSDIELGVGYDDSELYGDVTFFSVYLFFYGN
jgi:hypothetical protein